MASVVRRILVATIAAGQVGTPRASRHSVNPQQICFAEICKYKNINSSWLVGLRSFDRFEETFILHFTSLTHHDEAEGGRYATSLCFGFAAGQVGTPWASRHSVNPQQICFAEIRKYKNINSSWLVGVQSFSEIGDKKILSSVQFSSLHFTYDDDATFLCFGFAAGQVGTP